MLEVDPEIVRLFNTNAIERFLSKLELKENDCIEWSGEIDKDGYGRISFTENSKRTRVATNRWALQFALGLILPYEIKACHKCDNRKCVNPSHLFPGTHQDNMDDMVRKQRSSKNTNRPSSYKKRII